MMAVKIKNTGLIRVMLKFRPSINQKDSEGSTALDHARAYGTEEIVQLLSGSGAVSGKPIVTGQPPAEDTGRRAPDDEV